MPLACVVIVAACTAVVRRTATGQPRLYRKLTASRAYCSRRDCKSRHVLFARRLRSAYPRWGPSFYRTRRSARKSIGRYYYYIIFLVTTTPPPSLHQSSFLATSPRWRWRSYSSVSIGMSRFSENLIRWLNAIHCL